MGGIRFGNFARLTKNPSVTVRIKCILLDESQKKTGPSLLLAIISSQKANGEDFLQTSAFERQIYTCRAVSTQRSQAQGKRILIHKTVFSNISLLWLKHQSSDVVGDGRCVLGGVLHLSLLHTKNHSCQFLQHSDGVPLPPHWHLTSGHSTDLTFSFMCRKLQLHFPKGFVTVFSRSCLDGNRG